MIEAAPAEPAGPPARHTIDVPASAVRDVSYEPYAPAYARSGAGRRAAGDQLALPAGRRRRAEPEPATHAAVDYRPRREAAGYPPPDTAGYPPPVERRGYPEPPYPEPAYHESTYRGAPRRESVDRREPAYAGPPPPPPPPGRRRELAAAPHRAPAPPPAQYGPLDHEPAYPDYHPEPAYPPPGYGPAAAGHGPPYQPASYDPRGRHDDGYGPVGRPGPAAPGYGPPGYGEPGYGPPGYGEPGYGPSGYGEPGYSPDHRGFGPGPDQASPSYPRDPQTLGYGRGAGYDDQPRRLGHRGEPDHPYSAYPGYGPPEPYPGYGPADEPPGRWRPAADYPVSPAVQPVRPVSPSPRPVSPARSGGPRDRFTTEFAAVR